MARNIRNLSVKSYEVVYGVVEDGKLSQYRDTFGSASPRKLMREISNLTGVSQDKIVIVSTNESDINYRISDIARALQFLADNGLAEIVQEPADDSDSDSE